MASEGIRNVQHPDSTQAFSALILAGGKSTRMGRDKAFLDINGLSLIENLIAQIEDLFEEILVCGTDPEKFAHLGKRVAIDPVQGGGPLAGILSGLRESRTEANFVFSCDIPYADRDFLVRMMAASTGYDLVIPRYRNGFFEPLLGIYRKSALPVIEARVALGRARIAEIFPLCRTRYESMDEETWYRNLNTADEYSEFLKSELMHAAPGPCHVDREEA